jgi:hypothetical protein
VLAHGGAALTTVLRGEVRARVLVLVGCQLRGSELLLQLRDLPSAGLVRAWFEFE